MENEKQIIFYVKGNWSGSVSIMGDVRNVDVSFDETWRNLNEKR